jgi:hypothetical protein
MPDSISQFAEELMRREMARNADQFREVRPVDRSGGGMSPHALATIGGLADAASTYAFMKRGTGREANGAVTAIAGTHPTATALTAIGGMLATKAATKAIGKKYPRLAAMLAANLGAEQLSLAVANTASSFGMNHAPRQSSFGAYGDAMIRSGVNESQKKQGY